MSLAKKYNRRDPQRDYRRRPEWMQNNYTDEYRFGIRSRPQPFRNMDYNEHNYWPSYRHEEDFVSNDYESFEEDNFMSPDEYGVDRFSRSDPGNRRYREGANLNRNYRRGMKDQSGPYYSDDYYYTGDENRNSYTYEDEGDYDYDYYESYPGYGQVSEEERRFRRSNEFPQSGFEKRQRSEAFKRRGGRLSIRDKRY